ncbi:MAG: 50S ribosomal protein L4 [Candidatus Pelagibacter sp.]|nr:50S ribosomal protein L4 [Candidatus Pelagibacter sp.]OUW11810.1 MAG: 50S ribosomal protein L4 [Candidatus Pelagibacter sp. TMED166]|tara:strand:+ start:7023 stop:7652 length:630 start_codon:yes stop_codon:yes gene_type:complete
MKIEEINIEGKNVGFQNLSDDIFSLKPRKDIIQSVLDWQKNRMFKKTGHTKSRSEVKGSRRKIVQQKGSGGARHGNITAPIFVGGGVAHGPRHRGKSAFKKLNKKVKRLGLKHALSVKVKNKQLSIFNEPKISSLKTKHFKNLLKNLKSRSALFIYHKDVSKNLINSLKNIPNTKQLLDDGTNVYDLIKYDKILFTNESIKKIEERLLK